MQENSQSSCSSISSRGDFNVLRRSSRRKRLAEPIISKMHSTLRSVRKGYVMTASSTSLVLATVIFAPVYLAHAQKQNSIPRIGILRAGALPPAGAPDEFLQSLRDLGYVEKKNIVLEIRYAEGNRDRPRLRKRAGSIESRRDFYRVQPSHVRS